MLSRPTYCAVYSWKNIEFTVERYENKTGKPYSEIDLYLCNVRLGPHQCDSFHPFGCFGAIILSLWWEHQRDNFLKILLHFSAIYQSNNYQNILIFIARKYCSDIFRGIPTMVFDLPLNLWSFVYFLFEKPFLCKVKVIEVMLLK